MDRGWRLRKRIYLRLLAGCYRIRTGLDLKADGERLRTGLEL